MDIKQEIVKKLKTEEGRHAIIYSIHDKYLKKQIEFINKDE